MHIIKKIITIAAVLTAIYSTVGIIEAQPVNDKKVIEYGWDFLTLDTINNSQYKNAMKDNSIFDGVAFRMMKYDNMFDTHSWGKNFPDRKLKEIKWPDNLTDNFIYLGATNYSHMNWFNDRQWRVIENNMKLISKGIKLSNCVGVFIDPEPYGPNPWGYTKKKFPDHTFGETLQKANLRGRQFMQALQSQKPNIKILTFKMWEKFVAVAKANPQDRQSALKANAKPLFLAFLRGMVEAAGPRVRIIDGNERGYLFLEPHQYQEGRNIVYGSVRSLMGKSHLDKVDQICRIAMPLYIDQHMGMRKNHKYLSHFLSPKQRLKLTGFEFYQALEYSDKYVWIYSEGMNWWKGQIPSGLIETLKQARNKYKNNKQLGYSVNKLIKEGRERRHASLSKNIRKATIHLIATRDKAPLIDGKLNDSIWKHTQWLKAFVSPQKDQKAIARTQVKAIYDKNALYIAVLCEEPHTDKMKIVGAKHDNPVWKGDDIELFISQGYQPTPFYHFAVNPNDVTWDAKNISNTKMKISWNGPWKAATQITRNNRWAVEIKIPWKTIRGKPKSNSTRYVNICRNRKWANELSCWSPTDGTFVEPWKFGIWTFEGN